MTPKILSRGDGEESEKSYGKRVKVPVDSIPKAHPWLPDGALASGVQIVVANEPMGCILLSLRMPKWKSWLSFKSLGRTPKTLGSPNDA